MPNRCIKCNHLLKDEINILTGCPYCNGKKFSYFKTENNKYNDENKEDNNIIQLQNKYNKSINYKISSLSSIKIINHGSYELNLDQIFKKNNYVIALQEEGKYIINLSSILKKKNK